MERSDIYQPTRPLRELPAGLRLPGSAWRFLLCCDGVKTAEQIRRDLQWSPENVQPILRPLLAEALLVETEISWEEHAQAVALIQPGTDEPQTLEDYLGDHSGKWTPGEPTVETAVPFTPLPLPAIGGAEPSLPPVVMSLKSIIEFILSQSADATEGQLTVYRVFMGIDTKLLRQNGITSLRFHDDHLIEDHELQQAILKNIEQSLHLSCPESVYAT